MRKQFYKRWTVLPVYRERRVSLFVIDIEINCVQRDFLLPISRDNLAPTRFRIIRVTALLEPQGPKWRQRSASDQRGIIGDNLFRLRAGEKIIIQFPAHSPKRKIIRRFFSEIEAAAIGVIEKQSVRRAISHSDKKRNRFV